jgi:hypothetical protein
MGAAGEDEMSDNEPVAFAAINDNGDIAWIGYTQEAAADGASGRVVVPLYRSPTLTDEEREAIKWFATYGYSSDGVPGRNAATLRGLLERTR